MLYIKRVQSSVQYPDPFALKLRPVLIRYVLWNLSMPCRRERCESLEPLSLYERVAKVLARSA